MKGQGIRFATTLSRLGAVLVAQSDKGICDIAMGDEAQLLVQQFLHRFPDAQQADADRDFQRIVGQVAGFIDSPRIGLDLALDLRGTPFQQKVWQALTRIPAGQTASYTEIACRIGHPKSVRAAANACGANRLAVAIPCHRALRLDGVLTGYRWGIARKRSLLEQEAVASVPL